MQSTSQTSAAPTTLDRRDGSAVWSGRVLVVVDHARKMTLLTCFRDRLEIRGEGWDRRKTKRNPFPDGRTVPAKSYRAARILANALAQQLITRTLPVRHLARKAPMASDLPSSAPATEVASAGLFGALPCPFCGSRWIVKGERYFAMCVDCGATGPERNADATERKFTGDWNARVQLVDMDGDALLRTVNGALRSAITAHGPITRDNLGSAGKRIANQLSAASNIASQTAAPKTSQPQS